MKYAIPSKLLHPTSLQWRNYGLLGASIIAYFVLAYFAPKAAQNSPLKFNQVETIILVVSIILPYMLTWTLAVHSLTVLEQYLRGARGENDELHGTLKAIRHGLGWLVFSLIATALVGQFRNFFPDQRALFTILTNYLYIFPALAGFWLMYRRLNRLRPARKGHRFGLHSGTAVKTVIVGLLAIFYIFLVFTNPNRQMGSSATVPASYFLPDWLIVITVIIPVIISWWLGFSVAFVVGDVIPKVVDANLFKGLTRILYGMWAIIFTSILIQALQSLGTARLLAIGLGPILALLYLFVIMEGLGYLFLVLGIRKLQKANA